MSEQDIVNISAQLAAIELPSSPLTGDDSIVEIAAGEYEDPRQTFTVRVTDDHGEKINAVGKLQRSVTGVLSDGTTILVSAFGEGKVRSLKAKVKLGGIYTFRGKYKEKTEPFLGQEKTSRFLNL
jgi:hypothetical protein